MCADMVGVQWKDYSGDHAFTALLEDISHSGACLQTDVPLPLRTRLQLHYQEARLEGTVCYCFFREIGYWVGVTFSSDTKWSRRQFRPKHMLNVNKLLSGQQAPGAPQDSEPGRPPLNGK